jgi:hypothetical protein
MRRVVLFGMVLVAIVMAVVALLSVLTPAPR